MTHAFLKLTPTSVVIFFLVTVPEVFAQDAAGLIKDGLKTTGSQAGYKSTPLTSLIGNLIQALLGIVGVIFLVITVYAGFLWMTAQGDTGKVDKAKKMLSNSIIGIVIVVAAYAFTSYVVDALVKASSSTQPG